MGRKKTIKCILKESEEQNNDSKIKMIEMMLAYGLLLGILLLFRDLAYNFICMLLSLAAGAISIVEQQYFQGVKQVAKRMKTGEYIAGMVGILVMLPWLMQGFLDIINRMLLLWNFRFETDAGKFAVDGRVQAGAPLLWILVSLILSVFIFQQIKNKKFSGIVLLLVVALAFGLVLGQSLMSGTVLFVCMIWIGTVIFYCSPGRVLHFRGAGVIAIFLLICGVILSFTTQYTGSSTVEALKEKWKNGIEKIRYGEDTLPEGDFRKAQDLTDDSKERLKLTMSQPQEMYLRGFVGGSYKNGNWKELRSQEYQDGYDGIFQWLEKNNFSPVVQYGMYQQLTDKDQGYQSDIVQVQVKNTDASRKYLYLPATTRQWKGLWGKEIRDSQVRSQGIWGTDQYEFTMVSDAPMAENLIAAEWLENASDRKEKKYLDTESVYHAFAEDHYCTVSDEMKTMIEEIFFKEGEFPKEKRENLNEVTLQIRRVLRSKMWYSTVLGEIPQGEDPVEWFLRDLKIGNAMYFASAAVLAYRTAGFPARYVEGYHFSEEEAKSAEIRNDTEITLTSRNAHVWVEVYVAGSGWLPVEVVPGMYTETYTNEKIEGRPAYQVNSNQSEDGLDASDQGSKNTATEQSQKEEKKTERRGLSFISRILLGIAYLFFVLYLLLELQRWIRLKFRERSEKQELDQTEFVQKFLEKVEKLFALAKIKGDYTWSEELWEQISGKFPEIRQSEYERVLELVQKIRFGDKELKEYELYTLRCFERKMEGSLYSHKRFTGKIFLRYVYLLG